MPTALELFERHHVAVHRFLRRMGVRPADAEDLTQQAFLRILRALPRYQERQRERAWVFRIVRNVRLDHWRAHEQQMHEPREVDQTPTRAGHPDRLAIEEALAQLGEPEREAFLLREVGGLGYVEIAEATSATPDAVRSRIHRARLALREALSAPRLERVASGRER